ncbi:NTP pyrophosphohydrolase [Kitasatospora sp. KL5]|uniref:NTP pyrophosphohydrolase n=1 Tax=Kitasatospora sp. KL5 TaxID=3425125 RepID=UPI003D6DFE08
MRESEAVETAPLVLVDAANVVGSVPDGWWRDRRGAAERLRDALAAVARDGLAERSGAPEWSRTGPLELVLVVEGAARGVASVPLVRADSASGSGDDRIVDLVRAALADHPDRNCLVVTADRGLRDRVTALGADVVGPRAVRPAQPRPGGAPA